MCARALGEKALVVTVLLRLLFATVAMLLLLLLFVATAEQVPNHGGYPGPPAPPAELAPAGPAAPPADPGPPAPPAELAPADPAAQPAELAPAANTHGEQEPTPHAANTHGGLAPPAANTHGGQEPAPPAATTQEEQHFVLHGAPAHGGYPSYLAPTAKSAGLHPPINTKSSWSTPSQEPAPPAAIDLTGDVETCLITSYLFCFLAVLIGLKNHNQA